MKKLRWPVKKEDHEYMRMRGKQNEEMSRRNPNELWMKEKLNNTGMKWSRQSRWGYRIFDFWNHLKGIAIEVDGPEHNKNYDSYRDKSNLEISGIMVIRVRNRNEEDANIAIHKVMEAECCNERRMRYGLKTIKSVSRTCPHCISLTKNQRRSEQMYLPESLHTSNANLFLD